MNDFSFPVRVYYEDTDAGGVVYHANYLDFYERARTEMLRACNISQYRLINDSNIAFVVKNMNIDFLSPVYLDDLLTVKTKITKIGKASMCFSQQIESQDGKICNKADVLVACINIKNKKPCAFPESFISEFYQWTI